MELILPRFVAIDSSILASWAKDAFASDSKNQALAHNVKTSLLDANWIPIICLHHFIELARHSDLEVAARRIDFLKSFSQIAWLGRSYGPTILGAVVDVFEAEVAAIVASPYIDFSGIRRSVRENWCNTVHPLISRFLTIGNGFTLHLNQWRHTNKKLHRSYTQNTPYTMTQRSRGLRTYK